MKKQIKKLPVIGPLCVHGIRKLRGINPRPPYIFHRIDGTENDRQRILNLLNYTKTSGSDYNGQDYPAGYHTLDINGLHIPGQRQPQERLQRVPYDFTDKVVLDIGSNQGGMLFSVADKITHGIGIDFDYRLVNAANRIKSSAGAHHLDFYVFNLEQENLDLIRDFLPDQKVDIVFLLAVCMWIDNWRQVISLSSEISDNLLFESNGTAKVQDEQIAFIRTLYSEVILINDKSSDDDSQQSRRLYLCHR